MASGFFAILSRLKYINRWALMRNTQTENLSEHTLDTAFIAHALIIIDNKRFELKTPDVVIKVDPARADLIETRIIGGVKYIMINADENVEVNGVNIHFEEKEPSAV